jgi:Fe-S-cluster-containing dehydrogenase component
MIHQTMNKAAPLFPVTLDASTCIDCGSCLNACPTGVFQRVTEGAKPQAVHAKDCHVCFLCVPDCPSGSIEVTWDAPNDRQISVYDKLGLDLNDPPAFKPIGA